MSWRPMNAPPSRSRLYRRPGDESKIAGVCGGLADYLGINANFVRFCALIGLFTFTLPTLIGYFVLVWALDERPQDLFETDAEKAFWRSVRVEPSQAVVSCSLQVPGKTTIPNFISCGIRDRFAGS